MFKKLITSTIVIVVATGCATNFIGDPHIESGRSGCEAMCRDQGMTLAGMVFMGEYTSGCVCTVPGQNASREQLLAAAEAGAAAGSTGVVMQMRRQQEQSHQHH